MSFFYADFESIGTGSDMLADQANELLAAIVERGDAVGTSVSGTPLNPGDPIQLSWLQEMQAAVDTVISAGKYGRFKIVGGITTFVPWSSQDLLGEVRETFSVGQSGPPYAWYTPSPGNLPMAQEILQLFYACEVLAYAGTDEPVETTILAEHAEGYGSDVDYNQAWANAQTDYGWDDGVAMADYMYNAGNAWTDGGDYYMQMRDERYYEVEVLMNGTADVRELWVANWFYGTWSGITINFYEGADFGTIITDYYGASLLYNNSGYAYWKYDLSASPLAPESALTISYKMNYEMFALGPFGGSVEYYNQIGNAAKGGSFAPFAYIIRPQFDRSLFLWTLPVPS